jgi:hypothetical protein
VRRQKLHDVSVQYRRIGERWREFMRGTLRFALAAEEAAKGMTYAVADTSARGSSGRMARRESPSAVPAGPAMTARSATRAIWESM